MFPLIRHRLINLNLAERTKVQKMARQFLATVPPMYEAREETPEEAKANSNATEEGKVVHPPGSPRQIVRSELYGMKIYLDEGPRDHLSEDGNQHLITV